MTTFTNKHFTNQMRSDVKPDMSDMTSFHKSYNVALTNDVYLDRYTPALSSKTLIYHQERITPGPNRYGTRLIRYVDPTVHYSPAGMDMRNSTKQTGLSFTYPMKVHYPQNVSFILG